MRGRRLVGVAVIGLALTGCTGTAPTQVTPTSSPAAGPPTTVAPPALSGTLYYFPEGGAGDQQPDGAVYSWDLSGTTMNRNIAVDWLDGTLSLTVSPDGKRVAWVGTSDHSLYVANVDGTGKKIVKKQVDGDCVEPAWSPDGRRVTTRIRVNDQPTDTGILDLDSGKFTAFPSSYSGCHVVWSGDGTTLAYVDGGIFLAKADGTGSRALKKPDGTKWPGNDLESISPDGKLLSLWLPGPGEPAGDVARSLYANTLIDTTTGAEIKPNLGGELVQALFTPDSGILARVKVGSQHELVLLSATGEVVTRKPEPTEAKSMTVLAYVP